jgi:hypothetical protein
MWWIHFVLHTEWIIRQPLPLEEIVATKRELDSVGTGKK